MSSTTFLLLHPIVILNYIVMYNNQSVYIMYVLNDPQITSWPWLAYASLGQFNNRETTEKLLNKR